MDYGGPGDLLSIAVSMLWRRVLEGDADSVQEGQAFGTGMTVSAIIVITAVSYDNRAVSTGTIPKSKESGIEATAVRRCRCRLPACVISMLQLMMLLIDGSKARWSNLDCTIQ